MQSADPRTAPRPRVTRCDRLPGWLSASFGSLALLHAPRDHGLGSVRWRIPTLRAIGAAAAACMVSIAVAAQESSLPAAAQSHGQECVSLPVAVERDGTDWGKPARAVKASAQPDSTVAVGLRERAALTLEPAAALKPVIQPRSERVEAGEFGGFIAFRSGPAGAYRISLEQRAWIEVVDQGSGRPAVVTQSDKRMRCFGVGKNLMFELAADTPYFVQLSGAARQAMGLLVSPPGD
jgi:hypothetical protein